MSAPGDLDSRLKASDYRGGRTSAQPDFWRSVTMSPRPSRRQLILRRRSAFLQGVRLGIVQCISSASSRAQQSLLV